MNKLAFAFTYMMIGNLYVYASTLEVEHREQVQLEYKCPDKYSLSSKPGKIPGQVVFTCTPKFCYNRTNVAGLIMQYGEIYLQEGNSRTLLSRYRSPLLARIPEKRMDEYVKQGVCLFTKDNYTERRNGDYSY